MQDPQTFPSLPLNSRPILTSRQATDHARTRPQFLQNANPADGNGRAEKRHQHPRHTEIRRPVPEHQTRRRGRAGRAEIPPPELRQEHLHPRLRRPLRPPARGQGRSLAPRGRVSEGGRGAEDEGKLSSRGQGKDGPMI